MLTPRCESCGERAPTVFATYRVRGHDIKLALCDVCSRDDVPSGLLEQKAAQLPMKTGSEFRDVGTAYVIVERCRRDDYFAHQPEEQPIAVFLTEGDAAAFVASKESEGYIDLTWEIRATPFLELASDDAEA